MTLLGEHGVLDMGLSESLRSASGFRNVLVHDYAEVDDDVVRHRLENLGDLRAFASEIARYISHP